MRNVESYGNRLQLRPQMSYEGVLTVFINQTSAYCRVYNPKQGLLETNRIRIIGRVGRNLCSKQA